MNFAKLLLATMFGFLLAYAVLPVKTAKAGRDETPQATYGPIYVQRANMTGSISTSGGRVVGFSCAGGGNGIECYIASQ